MARSPRESTAPLDTGSGSGRVPTGIKILAVLNVFGALFALVPISRLFALSHPLAPVAGVVLLAFVGAGLVFTYGLVTLQYWGWLGTVAFNVLSAILDLFTFDILGLIVSGVIVFYLLGKQDLYE